MVVFKYYKEIGFMIHCIGKWFIWSLAVTVCLLSQACSSGDVTSFDCDQNDPYVDVDGPEICDGKDNNCDGDVDESCLKKGANAAASDKGGYISRGSSGFGDPDIDTDTLFRQRAQRILPLHCNIIVPAARRLYAYQAEHLGLFLLRPGPDHRQPVYNRHIAAQVKTNSVSQHTEQ